MQKFILQCYMYVINKCILQHSRKTQFLGFTISLRNFISFILNTAQISHQIYFILQTFVGLLEISLPL